LLRDPRLQILLEEIMSQYMEYDPLEEFMNVQLDAISREWFTKWGRKETLGFPEKDPLSLRYFSRAPTPTEFIIFKTAMSRVNRKVEHATGVEAIATAGYVQPQWNGPKLSFSDTTYNFSPVPHVATAQLDAHDQFPVTIASMMLRHDDGQIKEALSASNVEDGPLSNIMTKESYLRYVTKVGRMFTDLGIEGKGEVFSRNIYEKMAAAPIGLRKELRAMTYKLQEPAKLQYDPVREAVTYDSRYEYTASDDCQIITERNGVIRYIPQYLPQFCGREIHVCPTKESKEKNQLSQLVAYVNSRFPVLLNKAYGYRGCPQKDQRLYMEIRFWLHRKVVLVGPSVQMAKWLRANNQSQHIKTLTTSLVEGDLADDDLILEMRDYTEPRIEKRSGLFWGTIKFSAAFFEKYKVLIYRPHPMGKFLYCKQDLDVSWLPAEQYDWTLQICTTQAAVITAVIALAGDLVQAVFKGSYLPHGSQYTNLKYPIAERQYVGISKDFTRKDYEIGSTELNNLQGQVTALKAHTGIRIVKESDVSVPVIAPLVVEPWRSAPVPPVEGQLHGAEVVPEAPVDHLLVVGPNVLQDMHTDEGDQYGHHLGSVYLVVGTWQWHEYRYQVVITGQPLQDFLAAKRRSAMTIKPGKLRIVED